MLISRYDRFRINYYRRCINLRIFSTYYLGRLDSLIGGYIIEVNRLGVYLHKKEIQDPKVLFHHLHHVLNFLNVLSVQENLNSNTTGKSVYKKIQVLISKIKQLLTSVLIEELKDDSLEELSKLPSFQRDLLVDYKIAEIIKHMNESEEE